MLRSAIAGAVPGGSPSHRLAACPSVFRCPTHSFLVRQRFVTRPTDSSNCCRGLRPELPSGAFNLLLKKFQRARQCGEKRRIPAFFKVLGKEALVLLLAKAPLSQEIFAEFHNCKQTGEIL